MAYYQSTTTPSSTGVKTRTPGFQGQEAEIILRPAPGSSTSSIRRSVGCASATHQSCDSFSVYSAQRNQECFNDRMASIWEWNGSSWVEAVRIDFDSFTATEFKYNVVIANSNYQMLYKVRG